LNKRTFSCDLSLLGVAQLLNVLDDLERGVLGLESLLLRLQLLTLLAERPRQDILQSVTKDQCPVPKPTLASSSSSSMDRQVLSY
jgi:hypothetical protein